MSLIGDTLHREADDVEPLARLVQAKTAGNPFFVTQFLKVLKEDGYLRFDHVYGQVDVSHRGHRGCAHDR